jgi:hypothetical protein
VLVAKRAGHLAFHMPICGNGKNLARKGDVEAGRDMICSCYSFHKNMFLILIGG